MARRGSANHPAVGRWATEADRAAFAAGYQQGYNALVASMQLSLLCGIVIPDKEFRLVKTEGWNVREVERSDYVGVGDSSLLRFLAPLLVRRRVFLTKEAYNISAYLVFQAKRYVDGCGGNTDAVIMEKNGHATNIHLRRGGRGSIEPQFQLMEHTLGELGREVDPRGQCVL